MTNDQVALFSTVFAGASLLVSILAIHFSLRSARMERAQYVSDLRREWAALHDHWARALLLFRGWDDYYVEASSELRKHVHDLQTDSVNDVGSISGDSLTAWINRLRAETVHVRTVTRFLAHCADLVVTGRIEPTDAYRVLGPNVTSHGRAIRWMCGSFDRRLEDWSQGNVFSDRLSAEEDFDVGGSDSCDHRRAAAWQSDRDQIPDDQHFGEQELVLALNDLLWSEMARWGDNYPHNLLAVARVKRRTGPQCRRRMARVVRSRGKNLILAWRLARRLRSSEKIPLATVLRSDLTHGTAPEVVRWGWVPWVRWRLSRW